MINKNANPLISVLIPVYNEEGNIQPLLERLLPIPVSYTHLDVYKRQLHNQLEYLE